MNSQNGGRNLIFQGRHFLTTCRDWSCWIIVLVWVLAECFVCGCIEALNVVPSMAWPEWVGFLCSAKCLHGSEPCAKHCSSVHHARLLCLGESEFWWVERGSSQDERPACAGNGKGAFGDCLPKRRSLQPECSLHTWDVPPSLDLRLPPPALFEPFLFSFLLISSSTLFYL